jgi:hypothetical protein
MLCELNIRSIASTSHEYITQKELRYIFYSFTWVKRPSTNHHGSPVIFQEHERVWMYA